jgi:uncharacterized protein (UPF0335 family)
MENFSTNVISADVLKSLIERIETLESEKAEIVERVKDVYNEAKSGGFDPKIMKQVIRMRKMKRNELQEQEELIEIYRQALGDI